MNDEYGLYTAQIVEESIVSNNRLRVKVLPHMNQIPNSLCPMWPCMFRGKFITGKVGDLVWVICNNDFSTGYVVGYVNYNTYSDDDYKSRQVGSNKTLNLSVPQDLLDRINKIASSKDASINFNIINSEVTFWNDNCIHLTNRDTGAVMIGYRSGSFMIMGNGSFHIGISNGNKIMSSLKLSQDGVSIFSESNVNIQGESVGLGDATSPILVTEGSGTQIGVPSTKVKA